MIDRKSTFSFNDDDLKTAVRDLKSLIDNKIYKVDENGKIIYSYKDEKGKIKFEILRTNLYYYIGMFDYEIACGVEDKEQLASKLRERAKYSASLQLVEKYMDHKGMDVSNKLPIENLHGTLPSINGKYAESHATVSAEKCTIRVNGLCDVVIPDTIYHGTPADITADEIGKKDANGKYHTRDGMGYYSFERSVAEWYIRESGGKVLEKKILPEDREKFICIYDTNGGVPFIYQDDLHQMSKTGKFKYLICAVPKRTDVIDIENYANFVDERDARIKSQLDKLGLRLPKPRESYGAYIKGLDTLKPLDNAHGDIN
jgi:hypothetical protein